jgi:rhodanese-related sulfurtransferase
VTVPEETAATLAVDPARARELIEGGAQLVDVRTADEHAAGHIAGATHVPLERLDEATGALERDRPLVVYCRGGNRSAMAAEALRRSGWHAHSIAGGLVAWAESGLPLEPPDGEVAPMRNLPPR